MEVKNFIKKACTNLLLQSSKYDAEKDQKNVHRKQTTSTSNLLKPDFKISLDHLGPLVCYFYGIDQEKGILIGDGAHAITCHLRPEALELLKNQIKDLDSMIGRKIVINQYGNQTDQDEFERKQKEREKNEKYKNIKVNALSKNAAKKVVLKICLKRDPKKSANYTGSINQRTLDQNFKFVVRLEVSCINFIEEDTSDKLIVHSKPVYIEDDQNLGILFKSKFINQQRFELEKSILQNSTSEVTELEDLFEGSLFIEDKPQDGQQTIDVKALNLTREMIQYGFEKVNQLDQEMIDGLESQEIPKDESIPGKTRS